MAVIASALGVGAIEGYLRAATGDSSANHVLGQVDFFKAAANFVDASGMDAPRGIAVDTEAGRVYVADTANNRVLGWSSEWSLAAGDCAALVIGQPDFNSAYANQGVRAGATTLNQPVGVAVDASHNVYVADTGNNRVTVYSDPFAMRAMSGQTASFAALVVFGQSGDLMSSETNDGGISADSLASPQGLALDAAGNLFVDDADNNRILVYFEPLPATEVKGEIGNVGDPTADLVFGQGGNFKSGSCNKGGLASADQLCFGGSIGVGLALDRFGNLFASDTANNRALEFNGPFGAGEINATRGNLVFSRNGLLNPSGIAIDRAGDLYIASESADQIVEYNDALALSNTTNADLTIGASVPGVTSSSLNSPMGLAIDANDSLYVADMGNNRALRFVEPNPPANKIASGVAGQGAYQYSSNAINLVDAIGMDSPSSAALDSYSAPGHPHLYVADARNNRVLGWYDVSSFAAAQPADLVLGQPSLSDYRCRGLGADSLCAPAGLAVDRSGNVYVSDARNNRVLIFSDPFAGYPAIRKSAGFVASAVLGQPSFTSAACASAATLATLCAPAGLALDSAGRLYVADSGDNRVVEFDAPLSFTTGANVLGQANPSRNECDNGGTSATTMCAPRGVAIAANGVLYVADTMNNRVLEFDSPLTSRSAARVFGQSGIFSSNRCNAGATTNASVLCAPLGVAADRGGHLYVADSGNNRVLEFDDLPGSNGAATFVIGQGAASNFSGNGCAGGVTPSDVSGIGPDSLCMPNGVFVDRAQNLWIVDSGDNRVVEINHGNSNPAPN